MNVLKFMQPKLIMLEVGENLVVFNMVQNVPADNVLKKLQVIQVRETGL